MRRTIEHALKRAADPKRARVSVWFFKTGKGQYGEGDVFLGISVPEQRHIAHEFADLSQPALKNLLRSKIHEYRFTALEILVIQYERGDASRKKQILQFYLRQLERVNNWDLVDTSAPYILGHFLHSLRPAYRPGRPERMKILRTLATSKNLWKRRVAIVSTLYSITQDDYQPTLAVAKMLLADQQDLIQKATGWMLREVGKRSLAVEEQFLQHHAARMPRVMLRYAVERFPEKKRQQYLRIQKR